MTAAPDRPRTLLAFDYGRRRIGVAVGYDQTVHAGPLTTVPVGSSGPDWSAIQQQVVAWEPSLLIVGLPYNMDGTDNELTDCARRFTRQLQERFGLPVHTVDERLTSHEARVVLREQRREGKRKTRVKRGDIDRAAAALILETWLHEHGGEKPNDDPPGRR